MLCAVGAVRGAVILIGRFVLRLMRLITNELFVA